MELLKTLATTDEDKNIQLKRIASVAKRGERRQNPKYQAISPGFRLETPSLVIVGKTCQPAHGHCHAAY